MGKKLDEALKKGDMKAYKKFLLIRIFFDILIIVAIFWSFYYTGQYYAGAYEKCVTACPCIGGFSPFWSGEDSLIINKSMFNSDDLAQIGVLSGGDMGQSEG